MIIKSNEINIKHTYAVNTRKVEDASKKQKVQNCPFPPKYLHTYESVDTAPWRK